MVGTIVPKRQTHAIESATFAAEWLQPLTEDIFKQLLESKSEIAPDLPRQQIGRGITISLGPAMPASSSGLSGISNLIFDFVKPDGEASWAVLIQSNQLVVVCREYTRWSEVSAKAATYFRNILRIVMIERPITTVGLQYVDEFGWDGAPNDFTAKKLFKKSDFLPPNVFAVTGLWHSHHGFFTTLTAPVPHQNLHNINISVSDVPDRGRITQIQMAHRAKLETPFSEYSDELLSTNGNFFQTLKSSHSIDKGILANLLLPEISNQIGLEG
jgi:uncharacterized protein (TIGR04255 family)